MNDHLTIPRYAQPEVLAVVRLKPSVLQNWLARGVFVLVDQHPGSGRRRLFSALDVVKLAVMRRLADFTIDVAKSREIAEATAAELLSRGAIDWTAFLRLTMSNATDPAPTSYRIGASAGYSPLTLLGAQKGDWKDFDLAELAEPPTYFSLRRREGFNLNGPINPVVRAHEASFGFHSEPFLFFPVGEIVNGALEQLSRIDQAEAEG